MGQIKYFGPDKAMNMPIGWYKVNKDGSHTYLNEKEQGRLNAQKSDSLKRFIEMEKKAQLAQSYGMSLHRQAELEIGTNPANTNTPIQSLAPGIHQGYFIGFDPYKSGDNSLGFIFSSPRSYGKTEMVRQMYIRGGYTSKIYAHEMSDNYIANKYGMQLAAYKSILDYGTSGNFELAKSESTEYEKLLLIL